jgi:hypothetical protein
MPDVRVLIDTGAFNTMIDLALISNFGTVLPSGMDISIGGNAGHARFCIIDNLTIGGLTMTRVFALAYPFEGWLMGHIILGANILNNWDFKISRTDDMMQFCERLPPDVPYKKHPYLNYFKGGGYVNIQDEDIDL